MKIKVEPEVISKGKVKDPEFCPVSLSLQAITGRKWWVGCDVQMTGLFAYLDKPDSGIEIPLPVEVQERINHFDESGQMEPFEFEFDYQLAA